MRGATKRFGAVTALDGVDLDLNRGEVLALLGDNGAGKSTLIKCLSGVYRLDAGPIAMEGRPVTLHGPSDARELGSRRSTRISPCSTTFGPTDNFYAGRELAGPEWMPRSLALPEATSDDRRDA